MKKFAFVLLGLLTLFGGVALAACGKKPVVLNVDVPEKGITIFTNDQTMENESEGIFYQRAQFEVHVENTSANVIVQTKSGTYDVVAQPVVKANGNGNFTVQVEALKSGFAQLEVLAEGALKNVDVQVFTRPSKLVATDWVGTKPYVLKGGQVELDVQKYFSFPEDDVNLFDDVEWTFSNGETQMSALGNIVASISEQTLPNGEKKFFLNVEEGFEQTNITLRATLTHNNESQPIVFTVLDRAAIQSLSLQTNQAQWKDNSKADGPSTSGQFEAFTDDANGNYTVFLKRNDSNRSSISGRLVAKVPTNLQEDDFELVAAFYTNNGGRKVLLEKNLYEQYFVLNIISKNLSSSGVLTYEFVVESLAENGNWAFENDVFFYAGVRYVDFGYEVTTDPTLGSAQQGQNGKCATINLQTSFAAQWMELWQNGSNIKNNIRPVDVFSSYAGVQGFELLPLVLPDEVLLDNTAFEIVFDLSGTAYQNAENADEILKVFLADGTPVTFEKQDENGSVFVSEKIESGNKIFLRASEKIKSEFSNFNITFRSCSNQVASANLLCNLYHISTSSQGNLNVDFVANGQGENFVQTQEAYASSSNNSTTKTLQYKLKITGLSSTAGLSIVATGANNRFVFSPLVEIPQESGQDEQNQWVVFTFSVQLNGTNFEDSVSFTLAHTTGISINKTFAIHAFVPMENASLQNGSVQPANVYVQDMQSQNFVQGGTSTNPRLIHGATSNLSLGKLTLEVGTTLSLISKHQTLAQEIEFKFLDFAQFVENLSQSGHGDSAQEYAQDLFFGRNAADKWGIQAAADMFADFENAPGNLFQISDTRLALENTEFKGFVAAVFHGFNEQHERTTFVRIFALEAMFGVQTLYLSPRNIPTLYTTESLSDADQSLASATVEVALRRDGNIPTYTKAADILALGRFEFASAVEFETVDAKPQTTYKNDFYQISAISLINGGQALRFIITANSTKWQSEFVDEIKLSFTDPNGTTLSTSFDVEIKNMQRVENVQWTNRVQGQDEIYLNLTSATERTATISTSVSPSGARDRSLKYVYSPIMGGNNIVSVKENSIGQTFNLSISSTTGGTGTLFLLPNDMIKNGQVLVYKYLRGFNGEILAETPILLSQSQFVMAFEDIVGIGENDDDEGDYSNYFLNNNGEKIYNSNIILKIDVIVADGLSEETAIRIYTADELYRIDTSKFYRIMNNLTLEGWTGFENAHGRLSGMIAGNNEFVTITLSNAKAAFVDNNQGTIKNLTFAGQVQNTGTQSAENVFGGFVANVNSGTIENVFVDVASNGGEYFPSVLSLDASVQGGANHFFGGIVGLNDTAGKILNSFSYGQTVLAQGCYVGGIAGQNKGEIFECGVEFYKYNALAEGTRQSGGIYTNHLTGANVGGFVGNLAGGNVENTYAYAYPLESAASANMLVSSNSVATGVDAFAASANGGKISKSFAFVGASTTLSNLENCYVTTFENTAGNLGAQLRATSTIYISAALKGVKLTTEDIPTLQNMAGSQNWQTVLGRLDPSVWQTINIDSSVNFGFFHFKNLKQNQPVDLDNLKIADNVAPYKSLGSQNGNSSVLMLYRVLDNSSLTNAQRSQLALQNTINLVDLFEIVDGTQKQVITSRQARALVTTTSSLDVVVSSTNLQVQARNVAGITLVLHNKMDMSISKEISVAIVYALPEVSVFVDGQQIENNGIVQIQTGTTKEARHTTSSKIYLAGQEFLLSSEEFALSHQIAEGDSHVVGSVGSFGTTLAITAKQSHSGNEFSTITTNLSIQNLGESVQENTNRLVSKQLEKTFNVQVYDGATAITVQNANNLQITPSEGAPFDVQLVSDNADDGLVFGLVVNGQTVLAQNNATSNQTQSNFVFNVDEKLFLQVSWAKTQIEEGVWRFKVSAKVQDEKRHLLDADYDNITLVIYPKTQQNVQEFRREVHLVVKTQTQTTINIASYNIDSRRVSGGTTQFVMSKETLHDMTPGSDSILAVQIAPAYAMMTHFTLTYNILGAGTAGNVSLAKLEKQNGSFVINSSNTTSVANGLWVNLTEADKMGDGYFYFRVYVSSSFSVDCEINFTVQVFNGSSLQNYAEKQIGVDYMHRAEVRVNGASTALLAKGDTAQVTVAIGLDQTLTDLYIENFGDGISLLKQSETSTDLQKIFSYTLSASVLARLESGNTGVFYVTAQVERVVNGQREIKTSRAAVCLVDFAVDARSISVAGSGEQAIYQGQTYDVLRTYVGSKHQRLYFNYPMLPQTYSYNQTNQAEVEAVENLLQKRNLFEARNSYRDDTTEYYINYIKNAETGLFEEQTLKQQLWLYNGGQFNAIYNSEYNRLVGSDFFDIERTEVTSTDGTTLEALEISGLRRGTQLMRLDTTVVYENLTFVYEYYFLVIVDLWTDEEAPTQIFNGEQFVDYLSSSTQADDYILMNDIVLNNYTPLSTNLVNSLDGNGYTIHLNSFAPQNGSVVRFALFDSVAENTTLKNVRVNLWADISIDVFGKGAMTVDVAGFAIENNGIIYNCEVVSYFGQQQVATRATEGLVVKYTKGSQEIYLTSNGEYMDISSNVSGFVGTNTGSITNSRVGGESFKHVVQLYEHNYLQSQPLGLFNVQGQGIVSGFVGTNSGYISASFAKNIQITNQMNSTSVTACITAGFVATNSGSVQTSFVEGAETVVDEAGTFVVSATKSNISGIGIVAAFVYENSNVVKNCYANIGIANNTTKPHFASGFVYRNTESGQISLSFTASTYLKEDGNQLPFSGANDRGSQNFGKITTCYFLNNQKYDDTAQGAYTTGATPVADVINSPEDVLYGFSFSSGMNAFDGIWQKKAQGNGITLVSANQIAISNRYAVETEVSGGEKIVNMFYNNALPDADTLQIHNLSYGSTSNPIIIRDAEEFAMAMGHANANEYSYYSQYYNANRVWGNYRIVNNINLSQIDQNGLQEVSTKLTTTTKTFEGLLDGNGFSIEGINLVRNLSGDSVVVENFGLFAKLDGAVVMGLDLLVESITNSQANIVGTLAGTAVDSQIVAITLSPVSTTQSTNVFGRNVVGGVVGMLFGNSRLADIEINNINTYSSFGDQTKNPTSNDEFVGQVLRDKLAIKTSLQSDVEKISYAGAVAGYVDTYQGTSNNYVKFSNYHSVSNYNVVKIAVNGSVNVYGEVVGGLFGYVGESTYVYDAKILLNARDDRDFVNPSYIISRNLYAGGIVGENYGGLFAVQASYADSLQAEIETNNMQSYYNGASNVERGQGSIFSYDKGESGSLMNTSDPLYVGGIAGKMGGGYIFVGVSKLNVVSHSKKTLAVGGVVGLAAQGKNTYQFSTIPGAPNISFVLQDVFASGDLYADGNLDLDGKTKSSSGGIVGALLGDATPVLALKNVMAENYYSYANGALLGGNDSHFAVIGKMFDQDGNVISKPLSNAIYIINNQNAYLNIAAGYVSGDQSTGSASVGGYLDLHFGGQQAVALQPYGFNVGWAETYLDGTRYSILNAKHIGRTDMSTMPAAYRQNDSYFLGNGWAVEYWVHTQDELFPHIQLVDKMDYIFWDQFNTDNVLAQIEKNPNLNIIVRGKAKDDEYDTECGDIDLTSYNAPVLKNFTGKLYSYYQYMGSYLGNLGSVNTNNLIRNNNGNLIGGQQGEKVGLVVNGPLFDAMNSVELYGLNIYFASKDSAPPISYTISQNNTISESIIQNCRFVYNGDISVETQHSAEDNGYAGGVVTGVASGTSFSGLEICMRSLSGAENTSPTITITDTKTDGVEAAPSQQVNVYMGVLAGFIKQNSRYTNVDVSGITFTRQNNSGNYMLGEKLVPVNFVAGRKYTNFFAGLYAGRVAKAENGMFANIVLGLNNVDGVDISVSKNGDFVAPEQPSGSLYVGGYVGQISSVDSVQIINAETQTERTGIEIKQNLPANTLYAGLCFGEAQNSILAVQSSITRRTALKGKLLQGENISHKENYVGGFAGRINVQTSVNGFDVDFTVAKNPGTDETGKQKELDYSQLDKNVYDYSENLSSYQVSGGTNNFFGGVFGYVAGVNISLSGNISVSGTMDIIVNNSLKSASDDIVSMGGIIGRTMGSVESTMTGENDMNFVIRQAQESQNNLSARVGGIIGEIVAQDVEEDFEISNIITFGDNQNNSAFTNQVGNVVADVENLVFGGAIGFVQANSTYQTISVCNVAFGGAVKVFGKNTTAGKVTVGGIVGQFDWKSNQEGNPQQNSTQCQIVNCRSYGDVFVIYPSTQSVVDTSAGEDLKKLESYRFGGIVGSAPARMLNADGSANALTISDCSSLQTTFNNRLTLEPSRFVAGAIVGENADQVEYVGNKYSSGVNLCFQQQSGNQDLSYGTSGVGIEYMGYVGDATATENLSSLADILQDFAVFVNTTTKSGEKLKPFAWKNDTETIEDEEGNFTVVEKQIGTKETDFVVATGVAGEEANIFATHGIGWIANNVASGAQNSTRTTPIAENFANLVFVGNGQTMKFDLFEETTVEDVTEKDVKKFETTSSSPLDLGLVVNNLGKLNGVEADIPKFSAITSLIVDANVLADVNEKSAFASSSAFGGVAGTISDNSFVYAVGVQGQISVGGKNNQLKLGGIVGNMFAGMIDQCFVDAQISYRAAEAAKTNNSASISGVGTVAAGNGNTAIKATFTSGLLQTYVDVPVFAFANMIGTNRNNFAHQIVDAYSNSQVERVQLPNSQIQSTIQILSEGFSGTALNASYAIDAQREGIKNVSVSYWNSNRQADVSSSTSTAGVFARKSILTNGSEDSLSTWFFNPYVNYGYASHGFGFLKNVTTYTRTTLSKNSVDAGGEDITKQINEYEYTAISYASLMSNWSTVFAASQSELKLNGTDGDANGNLYLGVPNVGKFAQMLETIDGAEEGTANEKYNKNFRFVLKYNLDMAKFRQLNQSGEERNALAAGGLGTTSGAYKSVNVGTAGKDLEIDGNNVTLDFSNVGTMTTSLFGNVNGVVENLRLYNIDVKIANAEISTVGTLAQTLKSGKLQNVAVVGNLQSSVAGGVLGGVVGQANANLIAVESMVNVSGTASGVFGGVVGKLSGASISCSSNAGQVVANSTAAGSSLGDDYSFSYTTQDGQLSNTTMQFDVVVGGVVGAASSASILQCYNINSALAGYTITSDRNNCAGGIVGLAKESTISNAYNASLVGAGNYGNTSNKDARSEKFAFAGGIVGYGSGLTLVETVNNGKVEALGKMRDAESLWGTYNEKHNETTTQDGNSNQIADKDELDYTIETIKVAGTEKTEKFQFKDIDKLEYVVTLTLNPGRNRLVYAYGVGFVENLNEEQSHGNKSTTDSIKNDGCIGQVVQKQFLTFDRQYMLDNIKYKVASSGKYEVASVASGKFETEDERQTWIEQNNAQDGTDDVEYAEIDYYLPFWATFNALTDENNNIELSTNGYDSFGFPVRVYGVDRIARIYSDVYLVNEADGKDGVMRQYYNGNMIPQDPENPFLLGQPKEIAEGSNITSDSMVGDIHTKFVDTAPTADVNWDLSAWAENCISNAKNINNDIYRYYMLYNTQQQGLVKDFYGSYIDHDWNYNNGFENGAFNNFGSFEIPSFGKVYYNGRFAFDTSSGGGWAKFARENIDDGSNVKEYGASPYNSNSSAYDNAPGYDHTGADFVGNGDDRSEFAMGQTTQYPLSITFMGYDDILNGTAVFGSVDNNNQKLEEATQVANTGFGLVLQSAKQNANTDDEQDAPQTFEETESDEVTAKIQGIDACLESSKEDENFTIAGEASKRIFKETSLAAILDKRVVSDTITVDAVFDKDTGVMQEELDPSTIAVTLIDSGTGKELDDYVITSVQYVASEEAEGQGKINIGFRAYLNYEQNYNISAKISYKLTGVVQLGKSNLIDNHTLLLDEKLYSKLEKDESGERMLLSVQLIRDGLAQPVGPENFSISHASGQTTVRLIGYSFDNIESVTLIIQDKSEYTVEGVYVLSNTTRSEHVVELHTETLHATYKNYDTRLMSSLSGNWQYRILASYQYSYTYKTGETDPDTGEELTETTTVTVTNKMVPTSASTTQDLHDGTGLEGGKWAEEQGWMNDNTIEYWKRNIVQAANNEAEANGLIGLVENEQGSRFATSDITITYVEARYSLHSTIDNWWDFGTDSKELRKYYLSLAGSNLAIGENGNFEIGYAQYMASEYMGAGESKQDKFYFANLKTTDGITLRFDENYLYFKEVAMSDDGAAYGNTSYWNGNVEGEDSRLLLRTTGGKTGVVEALQAATIYYSTDVYMDVEAPGHVFKTSTTQTDNQENATWQEHRNLSGSTDGHVDDAGNWISKEEFEGLPVTDDGLWEKQNDLSRQVTSTYVGSDGLNKTLELDWTFSQVCERVFDFNNIANVTFQPEEENVGYQIHVYGVGDPDDLSNWTQFGFYTNASDRLILSGAGIGVQYQAVITQSNLVNFDNSEFGYKDVSIYPLVTFNGHYLLYSESPSGETYNFYNGRFSRSYTINSTSNTTLYIKTFEIPDEHDKISATMQYSFKHYGSSIYEVEYSLQYYNETQDKQYGVVEHYVAIMPSTLGQNIGALYFKESSNNNFSAISDSEGLNAFDNGTTLTIFDDAGNTLTRQNIYLDVIGMISGQNVSNRRLVFARNNYQSGQTNNINDEDATEVGNSKKLHVTANMTKKAFKTEDGNYRRMEKVKIIRVDGNEFFEVNESEVLSGKTFLSRSCEVVLDENGEMTFESTQPYRPLEASGGKFVLSAPDYGSYYYQFQYYRIVNGTETKHYGMIENPNEKATYLVLGDDIHTGLLLAKNQNNLALVGDNHFVKYSGNANGSVLNITTNNLTLVFARNVKNCTESTTTLATTDVQNINLYGSYRNLQSEEKRDENGEIEPLIFKPITTTGGAEGLQEKNVKSYITVTVLDGKDGLNGTDTGSAGENVCVDILEDVAITVNKNILIAGDGGHGGNGVDGSPVDVHRNSNVFDGGNGFDAGKAGIVTVSQNAGGQFARNGVNGFGGFGGNGANGHSISRIDFDLDVYGGGAGGLAGALVEEVKDEETPEVATVQRAIKHTQFSGNGGVGGFGQIDPFDSSKGILDESNRSMGYRGKYYLAGLANGAQANRVSDADMWISCDMGDKILWGSDLIPTSNTSKASGTWFTVAFGFAKGFLDVNNDDGSNGYKSSRFPQSGNAEDWRQAIDGLMMSNESGAHSQHTMNSNSSNIVERLNISMIAVVGSSGFYNSEAEMYRGVVWGSGEEVNWGGRFIPASDVGTDFTFDTVVDLFDGGTRGGENGMKYRKEGSNTWFAKADFGGKLFEVYMNETVGKWEVWDEEGSNANNIAIIGQEYFNSVGINAQETNYKVRFNYNVGDPKTSKWYFEGKAAYRKTSGESAIADNCRFEFAIDPNLQNALSRLVDGSTNCWIRTTAISDSVGSDSYPDVYGWQGTYYVPLNVNSSTSGPKIKDALINQAKTYLSGSQTFCDTQYLEFTQLSSSLYAGGRTWNVQLYTQDSYGFNRDVQIILLWNGNSWSVSRGV